MFDLDRIEENLVKAKADQIRNARKAFVAYMKGDLEAFKRYQENVAYWGRSVKVWASYADYEIAKQIEKLEA
jgi:hypothetical protein